VRFDDTGFTNLITLVTNVTPYSLTVSNNAKTYTLTNDGINGFQANPSGGMIKDGPGLFILGTTNSYTSFTSIKQGTLRTAGANAIGRGIGQSGANLTNNGLLDMNGFSQNVGTLNGSGVITNSSSTPVILQAQAGAVDGGTFTGRIDEGSGGAIQLNKSGGTLTMSGASRYSGGTHLVTGGAAASRAIVLGGDNVLGTGPVVFELNAFLTADSSPRILTNAISIQNINAGFSLGSPGAAQMTLSGPFDVNAGGGDQAIIFPSDVVLSGPFTSTSGGFSTKDGPATLRLLNNTVNWVNLSSDSRVSDGTMIIDGANVIVSGATTPNFRVQSIITNGLASLYVTNGGSLTIGTVFGYGRLRLGDTTSAPGSTNVADIRGTLIADGVTMGYSNTNNIGGGKLARLNLQPGSQVTVSQISPPSTNCTATTEINLDGATINAPDSASSSFLQGMTNVFIKSGGVTLNGANTNSIHIRQNLLSGGGAGGLTWNGTNTATPEATQLQLDGTNTYTGTTLINVGILGGIGTLASPVVMASGTRLFPGGGGNLGTLTVNSSFTMNGGVTCSFELNTTNSLAQTDELGNITNYVRLSNTNDMLVVSGALNITGGTINVNNNGPNLALGNTFKLFNKAAVGFTNVNLPTLDVGLTWQNNLAVDGSIKVVVPTTTPPTLSVSQTGNVLNFTWTDASFHLQSQTNSLSAGLGSNWLDYPGGSSSPVNVTINPAKPTVFFRLSQ
jgi:autotransporter-associated beta strand protein